MMKSILIAFILFLGLLAKASEPGCFTQHLQEASLINSQRKPVYARLAQNKSFRSKKVSTLLIWSEDFLAKFAAPKIDERAKELEVSIGFNVTCKSFVSMSAIGNMKNLPRPVKEPKMISINGVQWQQDLEAVGKKHQIELLPRLIEDMKEFRSSLIHTEYNCMVRHILDSSIRIAQIANSHQSLMHSNHKFQKLMWDLIDLQLSGINSGAFLDSLAAPLQQMGIPLICNDVPDIPEF